MDRQLKVLVTGSGGFLGYHLSRRLCQLNDFSVFGIDNFSRYPMDGMYEELLSSSNFTHLEIDMGKAGSLTGLPYFDYVFHFAALNGTNNFYSQPFSVIKAGVLPTINLLEHLTLSKPKKLIYAGTSESYAGAVEIFNYPVPTAEEVPLVIPDVRNSRWSYAASKTLGEVAVASVAQSEKFDFNIVRFHNVYGPRMGTSHVIPELIMRFRQGDFTIFGGANSRSFIYIDDAVDSLLLLLEDTNLSNEIVNIGNEDLTPISRLALRVQQAMGKTGEITDQGAPPGSPMTRCPDITKIRSIGYESKVSLEHGIQETLKYYSATR